MNKLNLKAVLPVLMLMGAPLIANADVSVGVAINLAPPPLPVYVQPEIPGDGYVWTPGYWAWGGDAGYYWVPGTWVQAPTVGYLWTPGYWGWGEGAYVWHAGYWGPHVGFYGGVNYGFGYGGVGFEGGYWRGGAFFYNRAVTNFGNTTVINNVYNKTVINNVTVNRVSYNGGAGGIAMRPTPGEIAAAHERHIGFTPDQRAHVQAARNDRSFFASVNHGRPAIAATPRPGAFRDAGVSPGNREERENVRRNEGQPHGGPGPQGNEQARGGARPPEERRGGGEREHERH